MNYDLLHKDGWYSIEKDDKNIRIHYYECINGEVVKSLLSNVSDIYRKGYRIVANNQVFTDIHQFLKFTDNL